MNTRTIVIAVLLLALAALVGYALTRSNAPTEEAAQQEDVLRTQEPPLLNYEASYMCEEGGTFSVRFGDRVAEVAVADGTTYTLAESGEEGAIRYTNEGDAFVFGTDPESGLAYIEQNGERTHSGCQESSDDGEVEETEGTTVSGAITAIDRDQVPVDGPTFISLRTESGEVATVTVPSFGINLCIAAANIADAFALEVGQRIEARGTLNADGAIVPCEGRDHFLRVVE